jgi:hypothetical protein
VLNWTGVSSSHIEAIGWDEGPDGGGRLWVRFKGGTYGHYSPCPESMYFDMLSAPSKGQYKHQVLILGGYTWTKANLGTAKGEAAFKAWAKARG